jgi:hypothetical protein
MSDDGLPFDIANRRGAENRMIIAWPRDANRPIRLLSLKVEAMN